MGQRPSSPASAAPEASAVAAARLLRGALEAALLPRLEALEGRMGAMQGSMELVQGSMGGVEGRIVEAVEGRMEAMEGRIVEAMEGRIVQRMMDMEQQREVVVGARERQMTAALEAMAAVMRDQGQGMGKGKGKGEEQGQRDEGHGQQNQQGQDQGQQGQEQDQQGQEQEQPLADTLAAQQQRIREELKVMWAGLWGGSACAWEWRHGARSLAVGRGGVQLAGEWASAEAEGA